MSINN